MAKKIVNTRIPEITSIQVAYEMYLKNNTLSNAKVKELFNNVSDATIQRLKALARERMLKDNVPIMNARLVSTDTAYKAWGIDIVDVEKRYNKLVKLGYIIKGEAT